MRNIRSRRRGSVGLVKPSPGVNDFGPWPGIFIRQWPLPPKVREIKDGH